MAKKGGSKAALAKKKKTMIKKSSKKKVSKTAGNGLGSVEARAKNAKFFSSFLPSGGFSLGLGSLSRSKVRRNLPRFRGARSDRPRRED